VVVILVPSQADCFVGPLHTPDIRADARTPRNLNSSLLPWEFVSEEHLSINVSNNKSRPESRRSILDVRKSGLFLEAFFDSTKSFAPSESSATSKKQYHNRLLPFLWQCLRTSLPDAQVGIEPRQ